MATDMFLKLDGVDGESKDDKHKDWIDIQSWSWGLSNPASVSTGGLGQGKVNASAITIMKPVDKASATLQKNCIHGKHMPTGNIVVRKSAGDAALEYIKIDLKKVFVETVSMSGTPGDEQMSESISLVFDEYKYEYQVQGDDGSGSPGGEVAYNFTENKDA